MALSTRAEHNISAGDKWAPLVTALSNVYNETTNPDGAVLMGIAENSLMREEFTAHMISNLAVDQAMHFSYGHGPKGSPRLRQALADHFNQRFNPRTPTRADEFLVTSAVASALDTATWGICDEGEGVLVPRPLYTGFTNDVPTRSRGMLVPVSFAREDGSVEWGDVFDAGANVRAFERARVKAQEEGIKVKALLITNPHNPLARCYPPETLKAIGNFAAKHNLHYISDEIYAFSIFSNPTAPNATPFHSILSLDLGPDVRDDTVHVMYGASKDFGANGLRLGTFYTRNQSLRLAMQSILAFAWPSYFVQDIWARMLDDRPWLDEFLKANSEGLARHYRMLEEALDARGIPYLKGGNATMFAWVDLAGYVKPGVQGEARKMMEADIAGACVKKGVVVARAAAYQAESDGWFRITFALEAKLLQLGLDRLFATLDELKTSRA